MGRAMLFLCSGAFVVFGMISVGVFEKQANISEMNVSFAETVDARNMANFGMERVLNQITNNPGLRASEENPIIFTAGEQTSRVVILDRNSPGADIPAGFVEVRSTGFSGTSNAMAVARIQVSGGLPEIHGSMGIFTNNLDFNVAGSAFLISGNDMNPDGTPGPEGSKHGIAVSSMEAFDEIFGSLNNTQKSRIQGDDESNGLIPDIPGHNKPSLELNDDMDGSALEEFVNRAITNADHHYVDHEASGEGSLGTVADPKIIIVDGTLTVRNATGAGIIVIREGGSLDARGNFDNYQGLIIIQGRADMTRGNINIIGAMLFGGANPSIEIDIDFRGNVHIQYSSQALANLTTTFTEATAFTQRLVSIYD